MPKKVNEEQVEMVQEESVKEITPELKAVRNRSGQRIELDINGETVVFSAGQTIEVPKDFVIPQGIGLFEKL